MPGFATNHTGAHFIVVALPQGDGVQEPRGSKVKYVRPVTLRVPLELAQGQAVRFQTVKSKSCPMPGKEREQARFITIRGSCYGDVVDLDTVLAAEVGLLAGNPNHLAILPGRNYRQDVYARSASIPTVGLYDGKPTHTVQRSSLGERFVEVVQKGTPWRDRTVTPHWPIPQLSSL